MNTVLIIVALLLVASAIWGWARHSAGRVALTRSTLLARLVVGELQCLAMNSARLTGPFC